MRQTIYEKNSHKNEQSRRIDTFSRYATLYPFIDQIDAFVRSFSLLYTFFNATRYYTVNIYIFILSIPRRYCQEDRPPKV